jgi:hypothetical protein
MKKIILFFSFLLFAASNARAEEVKLNCIFANGRDGHRNIDPSYEYYSLMTYDIIILLDEKKRSIDFLEHNNGKIIEWNDQRIIVDRSSYSPELKKTIDRIFTLNRYTGKLEHKLLGSVLNYNCSKANKKF